MDQLSFESFSNLDRWAFELDKRISDVLALRLTKAIKAWDLTADIKEFGFTPQVYNLCIKNQQIFLDPPLQSAKVLWTDNLNSYLCNLKLNSSDYYKLTSNQSILL